jgi:hypothetical protein
MHDLEMKKKLIMELMDKLKGDDDSEFSEGLKPQGGIEIEKVSAIPAEGMESDPMEGALPEEEGTDPGLGLGESELSEEEMAELLEALQG